MKGKATFTLAEAATGRTVKRLTEHNMITDAVQRILNPPLYTLLYKFSYSDFIKCILPLSQSVFGGIMLLGNTMEERADNIMLHKDCIPIATAGGPYSGANVMRGTLNQNESYATANGYHFTWDFGTDKANGTIKCAALTSRQFGNTGFSDEDRSSSAMLNPVNISSPQASSVQYFNGSGQYIGTFEKLTHTYFRANTSENSLTFMKYKSLDPDAVGVNDFAAFSGEQVFSTTVVLPIRYHESSRWFLNTETKVIYFSNFYYDNSQYRVDYAGISVKDFSVVETGTMPMPWGLNSPRAIAVFEGKIFVAGDSRVDIFSGSGERLSSYPIDMTLAAYFFMVNGVLHFINGNQIMLIYYNGRFYRTYNMNSYNFAYSVDIRPPYYPSTYSYASVSGNGMNSSQYLGLAANFLSTINNLSEPLEKTSEHTLKITYDITH